MYKLNTQIILVIHHTLPTYRQHTSNIAPTYLRTIPPHIPANTSKYPPKHPRRSLLLRQDLINKVVTFLSDVLSLFFRSLFRSFFRYFVFSVRSFVLSFVRSLLFYFVLSFFVRSFLLHTLYEFQTSSLFFFWFAHVSCKPSNWLYKCFKTDVWVYTFFT